MIHQQTLLPHAYAQQASPITQGIALGGIRKNDDQNIGNIAATYVPITNFNSLVFDPYAGVIGDLTAGTLRITNSGYYNVNVAIEATYTADNNQSRSTNLRIFDVTAGLAVPNLTVALYAGGYTAGFALAATIPMTVVSPGHLYRLELGGGSTFANFIILNSLFSITSIGSV
jgi:hypothetical protein